MSRQFQSLRDAALEIRRDIYKGPAVNNSSVQHWEGAVTSRERINYSYSIFGPDAFPKEVKDLIALGQELNFPNFHEDDLASWLRLELNNRLSPEDYLTEAPTEFLHPALRQVIEGNVPSYTYRERMLGLSDQVTSILQRNPDSRRAYWNIFYPQDTVRSVSSTRVPCSLGYQFLQRQINGKTYLYMIYNMRSCDVDTFWLTDVWMAHKLQEYLAKKMGVEVGPLHHNIGSFHSFLVDNEEIY